MEPQQVRTKKKVEWSSDLNSMEVPTPEERSPMWDSETDHLLSYFLGDSSGAHGVTSPPTHFATAVGGGYTNTTMGAGGGGPGSAMVGIHIPMPGGVTRPAASMVFEEDPITPPTPAIHYYHAGGGGSSRSSNKQQQSSSSSAHGSGGGKPPKFKPRASASSSSKPSPSPFYLHPPSSRGGSHQDNALMKAKASLLSDGTATTGSNTATHSAGAGSAGINNRAGGAGDSVRLADELSPISPAALIGSAEHEPMMLPPTPEKQYAFPDSSSNNSSNNNTQQSHLEWLQHINAMAKASIHSSNSAAEPPAPPSSSVQPSPQQQQQQRQQPPVPSIYSNMQPTAPMPAAPGVPQIAAHAIQQFSNGLAIPPHRAGDMIYTHLAQLQKQPQISEQESEEKRARRLERNRESARKSRRRKKERLSQLGGKVAALHTKLAKQRQKDINGMNMGLQKDSIRVLSEFRTKYKSAIESSLENNMNETNMDDGGDDSYKGNVEDDNNDKTSYKELEDELYKWMESTGPNCEVRRAVVDFQYTTLESTLLPKYEKFLLWLTLHQEEYFTEAKELHSKREGKQLLRNTSGKISSKQVGDELTNGRKLENGKIEPPPPSGPPSSKKGEHSSGNTSTNGDKSNPTAEAFDSHRMWPLLCFELSISVDQEDKLMQAHKRTRQEQHLARDRSEIAAATRMASRLKEAVLYQSHAAAVRSEKSYSQILTPKQVLLYQDWLSKNRGRTKDKLNQRRKEAEDSIMNMKEEPESGSSSSTTAEQQHACLMDLCKKLEEVLKISHKENGTNDTKDDAGDGDHDMIKTETV